MNLKRGNKGAEAVAQQIISKEQLDAIRGRLNLLNSKLKRPESRASLDGPKDDRRWVYVDVRSPQYVEGVFKERVYNEFREIAKKNDMVADGSIVVNTPEKLMQSLSRSGFGDLMYALTAFVVSRDAQEGVNQQKAVERRYSYHLNLADGENRRAISLNISENEISIIMDKESTARSLNTVVEMLERLDSRTVAEPLTPKAIFYALHLDRVKGKLDATRKPAMEVVEIAAYALSAGKTGLERLVRGKMGMLERNINRELADMRNSGYVDSYGLRDLAEYAKTREERDYLLYFLDNVTPESSALAPIQVIGVKKWTLMGLASNEYATAEELLELPKNPDYETLSMGPGDGPILFYVMQGVLGNRNTPEEYVRFNAYHNKNILLRVTASGRLGMRGVPMLDSDKRS